MRMILTRSASRPSTRALAALAVGGALTLAACGDESTSSASTEGSTTDESQVVATTSIWADITSNVACGTQVDAVIPAGADPHTFEASLRDRERMEAAGVIIANGNDLEESLVDLLATVAAGGTNVVEMTTHVDVITSADDSDEHDDHDAEADHDDHDEADHDADAEADHDGEHDDHDDADADHDDHGHSHGEGGDPHIWQDPTRVAGSLGVIESAVTAVQSDAAEQCTEQYHDELLDLDAEITELLADIEPERRVLVTSHDSLEYFADRYDFEVIGTVIPGTSTMAETNAADLAALADVIDEHDVPAIFIDDLASTADADALAKRLGVEIVPLTTDALAPDGAASTYVGMMRSNAEAIAVALGTT